MKKKKKKRKKERSCGDFWGRGLNVVEWELRKLQVEGLLLLRSMSTVPHKSPARCPHISHYNVWFGSVSLAVNNLWCMKGSQFLAHKYATGLVTAVNRAERRILTRTTSGHKRDRIPQPLPDILETKSRWVHGHVHIRGRLDRDSVNRFTGLHAGQLPGQTHDPGVFKHHGERGVVELGRGLELVLKAGARMIVVLGDGQDIPRTEGEVFARGDVVHEARGEGFDWVHVARAQCVWGCAGIVLGITDGGVGVVEGVGCGHEGRLDRARAPVWVGSLHKGRQPTYVRARHRCTCS
ncbi:glyceraldehyde-3-phosphate dehydrogenase [Striga asiatica]|uniref:Glyceraldehyde-3-phosphate dehydrogenase n=1 Tax=Striga asiatica TaxID=4170 RepID=A0A5A7PT86_STRAF|nr:glyceraldehyde-3-phosphate dehydrogenase [Striga asiatica]